MNQTKVLSDNFVLCRRCRTFRRNAARWRFPYSHEIAFIFFLLSFFFSNSSTGRRALVRANFSRPHVPFLWFPCVRLSVSALCQNGKSCNHETWGSQLPRRILHNQLLSVTQKLSLQSAVRVFSKKVVCNNRQTDQWDVDNFRKTL